jgi:hypothetical protein
MRWRRCRRLSCTEGDDGADRRNALAALLAAACAREPERQPFGTAVPEPARGLVFVTVAAAVSTSSAKRSRNGWRTTTVEPITFSGWALEDVARPASEWIVVELVASGERARFFAVTTQRPRADLGRRSATVPAYAMPFRARRTRRDAAAWPLCDPLANARGRRWPRL